MTAERLANLKDGQTKTGAQICAPVSQSDAAALLKRGDNQFTMDAQICASSQSDAAALLAPDSSSAAA